MTGEEGERTALKLDGAYRLVRPRSPDHTLPKDVVVQLHYFTDRELLIRKAWAHGPFEHRGGKVTILPNRRRCKDGHSQTLIDGHKNVCCSYKWGFPFHVIIRQDGAVFILRYPSELRELFKFLTIQPITVLDWLAPLPFQMSWRDRRKGSGSTGTDNHRQRKDFRSRRLTDGE